MAEKQTILFLCTGNSCRSQMAEAWTRRLKGETFEAFSAGVEVHGIDPRAVEVMAEVGLDISYQQSKHVDTFSGKDFDFVVTVCDHAHEACPFFPAKTKVMHVGFDDPPLLAKSAKSEKEALDHYRRVRDEIRTFVEGIPKTLLDDTGA